MEMRQDFTEKLGSPPPMRGIVLRLLGEALNLGITPAHAGNRLKTIQKRALL